MSSQETRQYQCKEAGHIYTGPASFDPGCPICSEANKTVKAEVDKTKAVYGPDDTVGIYGETESSDAQSSSPDKTVAIYSHLDISVDPVVGWLASIAGPEKGKDWRLVAGRNSIGRSQTMSISISDDTVSRERHAYISFEPRKSTFSLLPGDGTGLVYCNDEEVMLPVVLKPYDRIELGDTIMVFVPLAGEHFQWKNESSS